MDSKDALHKKIHARTAVVGVIGLGYVGLPLVVRCVEEGFPVLGFDTDEAKVQKLNAGESYIKHLSSDSIHSMLKSGRFTATTDFSRLAGADCILICVPTPLTPYREPDLTYVVNTVETISRDLRTGQLIALESTTYPGTTEEVLRPALEKTGLKAGEDFFLVFSPEREDPGNNKFSYRTVPKVVGGLTPNCLKIGEAFYAQLVQKVVPVSSTRIAEMTKLLENIYRSVNIALVNELKILCDRMGIDLWEVIDAAATKPYGFTPFYPGPGLGGHCLSGSEIVCVRDASGVRVLPFAELFDKTTDRSRIGDVDIAVPQKLEALSIDPATGEARFAPVTHLFRRSSPTPLFRLRLRDHRALTVTDGHPMLVWDGSGIAARPAFKLRPGDPIVILASWPAEGPWDPRLDLIEVVRRTGLTPVRVIPRNGEWRMHDALLRPPLRRAGENPKDVYRHNTLPLSVYLELEAQGCAPFPRERILLATGKGSSWNRAPAVIELDEAFARLIGYYLSEGCITEDGSIRIRFCFGAHEDELIEDTRSILGRLGIASSVHRLKDCRTVHVEVSSRILGTLFRDVLCCGTRSEEMRVPSRLMAAPEKIRRALVSGLLRGDGDVYLSSPILFQQMVLLLQGMGLVLTFRPQKPHLRRNGAQIEALAPFLAGDKRRKLEAYVAGRRKSMPPRSAIRWGLFATVALASIQRAEPAEVYSMEVAGANTFVTSYGIAIHNCIPIDPFYLTWKARQYDVATRFIELAGEVNTAMPYYIVSKIVDALNERGKSIKGARVLVLGVAYKKDVDDKRESPSLKIIERLMAKEAEVSYNDPYVPSFERLRHYDFAMQSVPLTEERLKQMDAVVIVTDHSSYDYQWIVDYATLVIDTRNATRQVMNGRSKIIR